MTFDNAMLWSSTDSKAANTVYAKADRAVGFNWVNAGFSTDWTAHETALYFQLPGSLAGKTIVEARLRLFPSALAADFNTHYAVCAFAGGWDPATLTHNTKPQHYTWCVTQLQPPVTSPWDIDVTVIVQNWTNGTWDNNGFLIWDPTTQFESSNLLRTTYFHSSDVYDAPAHRPQLYVKTC